jgi:hypothetical protein
MVLILNARLCLRASFYPRTSPFTHLTSLRNKQYTILLYLSEYIILVAIGLKLLILGICNLLGCASRGHWIRVGRGCSTYISESFSIGCWIFWKVVLNLDIQLSWPYFYRRRLESNISLWELTNIID